jgi:aspartate/methionine/tyrosine aminotransferase
VLERPVAGKRVSSTIELAEIVLAEAKVAIVPGEAFAAPGYARMSFALGDDDLGEGVARIEQLFAQ